MSDNSSKRAMAHIAMKPTLLNKLQKEARGKSLSLSSFCRMVLSEWLDKNSASGDSK